MNIKRSYYMLTGLKGKRLVKIPVLITVAIIYGFTLLYISLNEILWLNDTVAFEIKFGGYRDIPVNTYASIVSFLFIIMCLQQLHFIRCYAESIFNSTTNQYLYLSFGSDGKFYLNYFFWRAVSLLKINILYLFPLLLIYYFKDGVIVYTFVTNLYLLLAASLIIAVVFDLFFYLAKGVRSGEFITLFFLLSVSLLSFVLQEAVTNLDQTQFIGFIHMIPDVISIPYQYVLKSLGAIYSQTKLFNPVYSLIMLFIASILLHRNMFTRLLDVRSS
jgi:hypothetical protein